MAGACIGRPSLCTGRRQHTEMDARKHPPKGALCGEKPGRSLPVPLLVETTLPPKGVEALGGDWGNRQSTSCRDKLATVFNDSLHALLCSRQTSNCV